MLNKKTNDELTEIITPEGALMAFTTFDQEHPGIGIYLNGQLVSITEYDAVSKKIRTVAFRENEDEAVTITDFSNKEQ